MPLYVYRHQEVERLVSALAELIPRVAPRDPFEPLPIVVGSRHVERWLRLELATALGVAGNIAFPGPRAALRGAVRALLDPSAAPNARFWEATTETGAWGRTSMTLAVLELLRGRREEAGFASVRASVGESGGVVGPRELGFAVEVAHALERLVSDRPQEALAWGAAPARAPAEHRWLAELLRELHDRTPEPSPAQLLTALAARSPRGRGRAIVIFGLSSPSPHDRHHINVLAAHTDVHMFVVAPSSAWLGDEATRLELLAQAKRARDAEDLEAALRTIDRANPILAASGLVARETQIWIEESTPAESEALMGAPRLRHRTLLAEVQRFVDEARALPTSPIDAWTDLALDGSLEVHACHGALRQCEALRDALLARFADDPTLEPRHVLVMTPDVTTFGPLVQAVLARPLATSGDAPRTGLPVHVSDLGLRVENPIAEALVACLRLAGERVTATRILEFVAMAPVRRAFGLAPEDEPRVAELVRSSNLRWGWNAEDRARHDQPACGQNTVAFALERLALGTLFDGAESSAAPVFDADSASPATPEPLLTSEGIELFGKLAHLLRTLEDASCALAAPRTVSAWSESLRSTLDRLTAVDDDDLHARARLDDVLASVLPAQSPCPLAFDRASVLALVEGAVDLPAPTTGVFGGAITLCALEPMRAIAFRVIAIVGLSEGAFPRSASSPAWDPFARRRPGEPTRTSLDRHLFLEALVSARHALLLFGDGFDEKRGARRPLGAVCHEILATIEGHAVSLGRALREHSLQPWGAGTAARHFDPSWTAASNALADARESQRFRQTGLASTGERGPLPEAPPPRGTIEASTLARLLESAPRALTKQRLGVDLYDRPEQLDDREPLERDDLETWELYDTLLAELPRSALLDPSLGDVRETLRDRAFPRVRAEGRIPPGERGRFELEKLLETVDDAIERVRDAAEGAAVGHGDRVECTVGELTVVGIAPFAFGPAHARTLAWISPSEPSAARRLEAWIVLLAARAAGAPVLRALVASASKSVVVDAPTPEASRAHLGHLAAAYARSLAGPVLRVPHFSFEVAAAAHKAHGSADAQDPAVLVARALPRWYGSDAQKGALADRPTRELFGHLTDADRLARADEIAREAISVWGPLLAATSSARASRSRKEAP